jgi:hypothetical protein
MSNIFDFKTMGATLDGEHRSSLAKISIAIAITAAPPESKVRLLTELQIISTTLEQKNPCSSTPEESM